jgi:hypothetical protein
MLTLQVSFLTKSTRVTKVAYSFRSILQRVRRRYQEACYQPRPSSQCSATSRVSMWSFQPSTQYLGSGAEGQVLGDFKGTLNDCDLLNNQRFFQRSGGFVKKLCGYSQIEPEVRNIRERMSCFNVKVVQFPSRRECPGED